MPTKSRVSSETPPSIFGHLFLPTGELHDNKVSQSMLAWAHIRVCRPPLLHHRARTPPLPCPPLPLHRCQPFPGQTLIKQSCPATQPCATLFPITSPDVKEEWRNGAAYFPPQEVKNGCLTSQQHAGVSQRRICSDNTCCRTEIEVTDQTFYLTKDQYTDTGLTSRSADLITPGRVATGVPVF